MSNSSSSCLQSTLCDVEIGVLVYSQDEDDLAVWLTYGHMKQMFERFLSIPIVKMMTYEGLLTQRVTQETHKNNMEEKNNDKKEIQEIMNQIFEGTIVHLPSEVDPRVWPSHKEMERMLTTFPSMPKMGQSK
ncbi:hypothetical protein LOK49_LG14G00726 [Camellia lanceoleosa]|uniref:Uncharacterized protein n=1 Tax=Camellia lanceoleosa TaxID=1840588 RepID=A0ACC0FEL0_9ERIC|nr:hypothetical protein LOK49_LG14G00726 [Camellia lanceoleosa]